MMKKAVFKR